MKWDVDETFDIPYKSSIDSIFIKWEITLIVIFWIFTFGSSFLTPLESYVFN